MSILFHPANLPFTVALGVVVVLAVLQILLGALSGGDAEASSEGLDSDVAPALEWLNVGTVPLSLLAICFTLGFGLTGTVFQGATGFALPPAVAWLPALVGGALAMRYLGRGMAKTILRVDTTAVSAESFVGHTAVLTLGFTERGQPSQAKLRDPHGQTHYVLVEPFLSEDRFETGDEVILVERTGALYRAIPNSAEAMARYDAASPTADSDPSQVNA
jgi:hypothetical protein